MNLTGCIVCGLILVAWIVYQEFSWRSRLADTVEQYEERLSTEVDDAFEHGMDHGGRSVQSQTFRYAGEKSGFFSKKSRDLYLTVTLFDGDVKYLSGDLAHIEKFEIPPDLRKAILKAASLLLKP